ncbi:Cytochrome oxidase assembly protein [Popillia japonica]|uniref:Cytochrome oxidase assembly protein n=1 Tax=Popillia japonica TaxID=7064 RepID=A0AAW1KLT4_POPJA
MLSLARNCTSKLLNLHSTKLISNNLCKTGIKRPIFGSAIWNTQCLSRNNKSTIISSIRRTGTTSVLLSSNATVNGKKAVGYWLLTCSGMVFVAVVLGGLTRLTESGLSMVTWKLLGEKMPTTDEEWITEFNKYQQYPEFKIKNREMTLSEFKWIWYMEYGHRMWGRAIGAVFLIPAAIFWSRGMFNKALKIRIGAFGALIGAQGLMGWYMVKSGLEDRFHGESDIPRVSQYRLATHLAGTIQTASRQIISSARKFRMLAHSCKGMVFLTAISGSVIEWATCGYWYLKRSDPYFTNYYCLLSRSTLNCLVLLIAFESLD